MTQEEKDLLSKDLCARLPYCNNLLVRYNGCDYNIIGIGFGRVTLVKPFMSFTGPSPLIEEVKPYLRPRSSMTEEEMEELFNIVKKKAMFSSSHLTLHIDGEIIDYLNKKMFDWRGLIPMNLALEAPEGMYKYV